MSGKKFGYSLQVRWSDSDRLGHVNNTRFVEYLQEARAHFLTECMQAAGGARGGAVVGKLTVDFLRPIFDDSGPLQIEVSISRIGRSSYGIRHLVRDVEDVLCADAEAVMVMFDSKEQAPRPITDRERAVFSDYLDTSEDRPESE